MSCCLFEMYERKELNCLDHRIFIKEANAQRKFDDARTLQTSLDEIRAEIARLASG